MGCHRSENTKSIRMDSERETEKWIYANIKIGMSREEVLKVVGKPLAISKADDRSYRYNYFFDFRPHPGEIKFLSGFQIRFTDDKVSEITPLYTYTKE